MSLEIFLCNFSAQLPLFLIAIFGEKFRDMIKPTNGLANLSNPTFRKAILYG
jgi:hypothetical protein